MVCKTAHNKRLKSPYFYFLHSTLGWYLNILSIRMKATQNATLDIAVWPCRKKLSEVAFAELY